MNTQITEELKRLYRACIGKFPETITPLPASGSHRKYFRLNGEKALIGVYGESKEENQTFIYLAKHFSSLQLPVPEIYTIAKNGYYYLQEDLGDKSLFDYISGKETTTQLTKLLQATMRRLADIQFLGAKGLDFNRCYPSTSMDKRSIMWDLNYFKYCFLKAEFDEFDEITELNPDEADENDIVIDMDDSYEELPPDDIDAQIVKDVDKVFTTRKDETDISDSDLDFIDELNNDTDNILEELSDSSDSELEELALPEPDEDDGGILEEIQEPAELKDKTDDGILETKNSSTPIVPVYDADIPQEDLVVSDPIQQGDTVTHVKYGTGVVEKMIKYGNKTLFSINFDNIGRRLLDPTLTEIKKS